MYLLVVRRKTVARKSNFYQGVVMAKRYHQSKRDRMHESRGMKRYESEMEGRSTHHRDEFNDEYKHERGSERAPERRFRASNMDQGFYAGSEPRRRQEMEDAGMIYEDHNQVANLPQEVMMKPYEKTGPYLPEGLDDTIRGVDHQMDYDDSQRRKHFFPKKV